MVREGHALRKSAPATATGMTEVLLRYCENCNAEGASKRCSRCEVAWYCSKECQKQAWKRGHRAKCSVQAAAPPTAAPAGAAAATPAAAAAPTATAAAEAAPAVDPATVDGMSLREMKQLLVTNDSKVKKGLGKGGDKAGAKSRKRAFEGRSASREFAKSFHPTCMLQLWLLDQTRIQVTIIQLRVALIKGTVAKK